MDHLTTADGRLRIWETYRGVPPEALFTYWVEPAKLRLWGPPEASVDARVGGSYRYGFPEGAVTGTFAEVIAGNRLAFSWRSPGEAERQVVVDFERRDAGTLLTLTQGPYGRDEAEARRRQLERWQESLVRLRSALTLERRG
ncbi:SRPBCC family protein [Truepera radiovictrix]|uniref:Activator of Hsp90 ATPase 1 family protein n=1 Tax=Truepera radiovictrix (strain DSM 17093 / CIP 108686 / LMG 22925 / RQ-24) TaxID=649638 RepID=D7CRB5_TRURR|nr:SRPBCC domain-containing protein [Truepera radiovictrix]ADI15203.1 Activator of Hsp90 ATPase 1 family protein [Truepera radiovictrix DSM 17093]WMT56246.1 SRPBCC domain-containing protein [Truepera radiovictrix]